MTPLSRRRFGALALALFGAARVGLPAAPPATLFAFAIAGGMFHALRRREVRAAPTPGLALTLLFAPATGFAAGWPASSAITPRL